MNRYKLVNENRAKEFINSLKLIKTENLVKLEKILKPIKQVYFEKTPSLDTSVLDWEKVHLNKGWSGSEKRTFSDEQMPLSNSAPECFTEFNFNGEKNHSYRLFEISFKKYSQLKKRLNNLNGHIDTLERTLTENHESLNEFLTDDTLTFIESIFILIGLNPIALKTINVIVSNDIEAEDHEFFEFIDEALLETKEYRRLKKAPSLINNQTFIFYDKIYTKRLISWSIEKGFIQKIENESNNLPDDMPLYKYNDYRGWAKVHNTISSLVALELYEGKLTSTRSILKDKTFYEKLSKKLAPKTQDGQEKPKPKTLENYISEYNSFNK
jgi:hypothetical protein